MILCPFFPLSIWTGSIFGLCSTLYSVPSSFYLLQCRSGETVWWLLMMEQWWCNNFSRGNVSICDCAIGCCLSKSPPPMIFTEGYPLTQYSEFFFTQDNSLDANLPNKYTRIVWYFCNYNNTDFMSFYEKVCIHDGMFIIIHPITSQEILLTCPRRNWFLAYQGRLLFLQHEPIRFEMRSGAVHKLYKRIFFGLEF